MRGWSETANYSMNHGALEQLTIATDIVMRRALEASLQRLTTGIPIGESRQKLVEAQLEVRISGSGAPPDYSNEWLAPLYLAWYGPSHINMAYSLFAQVVSKHDDTLVNGPTGVHLEDYACGPFAGQFGFVLAAAEAVKPFSENRRLSVYSDDDSDPMWDLGRDNWKDFRGEVGALTDDSESYPHLDAVRSVAKALVIGQKNNRSAPVWLTVFHAAYPGETGERIKSDLDDLIKTRSPRLILLTAYKDRKEQLYCPPDNEYALVEGRVNGPRLALQRRFAQVTAWRKKLVDQFLSERIEGVGEGKRLKVIELLSKHPTDWRPAYFEYVYSLYVRK